MFYYTEETARGERYGKPTINRTVYIWHNGQKIGYIEQRTYEDGNPACDRWDLSQPCTVGYYEQPDPDDLARQSYIDRCANIADGKRKFSTWYAENSRKIKAVPARELPASPDAEFYPTPSALAGKMANLIDWAKVQTVLEPSAGKGDLIDYARRCAQKKSRRYGSEIHEEQIDCVEQDANLRLILQGKGYRVIADDFLTLNTTKQYDAILMNPPFANGDEHLLKAISLLQNSGGQIVCLPNAETIRKPYTNRRKVLAQQLAEYAAHIEFVPDAFRRAEQKSDVHVAIIYLNIPAPRRASNILEGLKRAAKRTADQNSEPTALAAGDWLDQMIANFELEAKAGVALMEEYNALAPYIMSGSGEYDKPMIQLSVRDHKVDYASSETINRYLRGLRYKYWDNLLSRSELTEKMTSNLQKEYQSKINEMQDYDFNRYNVKRVILEISAQLTRGVEETIYSLFDQFSAQHSWYPECAKNIHYYNGWATNKAHKVGMKVILPINGFYASYDGRKELRAYEFAQTISDIERALNYLDRGETDFHRDIGRAARLAESLEQTTIEFTYFTPTFYKKGTCHLKFRDSAACLIDRLNIFAARNRAWLPPDYGKKHYDSMDEQSRAVIDEFQGREAYEQVMAAPENYIISPASSVPRLTA